MGQLRDHRVPTKTVTLGDEEFVVQGLGTDAIVALVRGQGDTMRDLYAKAVEGKFTAEDTETLLELMLDESPILVGLIIAFGCDEPDEFDVAMKLPFSTQVELLEAIISLTFQNEGGAKKVMEIIIRAVKSAVALKSQVA